ncbi:MAG: oxalate/formate MFS antiporter [Bacteriovorax sp.]|nr:oxalate/formate MFS antiporter [Bacteriovorax sp.]
MEKLKNRWIQLALTFAVFIIISGPQYQWALFVKPLLAKFQKPLSEVQIVFSLVIVCMTFITPLAGYFHDRFNSKVIIGLGLMMSSGSWLLASQANSLIEFYIYYGVIGGLGAGIAFIGCTGLIQKCFPDIRGFATGILSSGYALGPILTTYSIAHSIDTKGIESTLQCFGIIFFIASLIVISGLRNSKEIIPNNNITRPVHEGLNSITMLKSKVFWLMFFMMCMIATCGMMITSNIAIIAKESGIGSEIIMLGMAALPLALLIDRITNGFSRILFGMISDKIGREYTLGIAFVLEALFMYLWFTQLQNPIMFILLSGMVFLAWGEIFSIFPALCTDTFGEKNASVNFGFLYTSVGIGSIFGGPLAALLREKLGNWNLAFYIIICLDLLTAFLAIFVLKRMRLHFKETIRERLDIQTSSQLT